MDQDLTSEFIHQLRKDFESRDDYLLRQNIAVQNSIDTICENNRIVNEIDWSFSHVIDDGYSVTNQKSSGRCWMFAGLNIFRYNAMQKMKMKKFEFSQVFPFFWDKLERANYWLESIIETANLDLDNRTVAHLLEFPIDDGGQWDMLVPLIHKYGAVPKYAMPETESSGASRKMNTVLKRILRDGARRIRHRYIYLQNNSNVNNNNNNNNNNDNNSGENLNDNIIKSLRENEKTEILRIVYRVLCIHLGTPPEEFDWQWNDKEKTFQRIGTMTPHEFAHRYIDDDIDDYLCLVHDPRPSSPLRRVFTVKYLGNMVGKGVRYLHVSTADMKDVARRMIEDGRIVWLGCDISHDTLRKKGLMAKGIMDLKRMYDTTYFSMNKAERLEYHDTMMTHAMAFTGVDIVDSNETNENQNESNNNHNNENNQNNQNNKNEELNHSSSSNGKPKTRRWRVENSWGSNKGQKGFFLMTDEWFEEHMFEIAAPRSYLTSSLLDAWETWKDNPIELPPWDPMGSLAREEMHDEVFSSRN